MVRRIGTYFKNAVSALCIALVSVQPVLAQQIIADTNGPQVIDTANGLPMVMINTPDANGVSHNTYTAFGVGPGGAILNNVDTNTATTQLGGIVQGNSNLSGGAAGVILNEVTSTNTSVLNGFLEVGGQRADVIVANPNGITCDGCGFINTSRLTITTGTPSFEGEQFTGFSVDGGAVAIGAGGLDASDTTTFDLLSRQITVGGVVSGQRIRIVAGRNDVLYATGEITEKAADGSIAPSLAIDSTALGGMFANAITITSTEDGVGVRAPRDMAANAGSMTITADGRLVVNNASASQSVTVRSTEQVVVQGNVAAQEVDVTSAEDLVLEANARLVADSTAILTTGGDLNVGANGEITATRFDLDIAGVFRIGNGADVTSVETLDVDADSLINMGTLAATDGALIVTTSLDLTNEGLMFGDTGLTLRSDADITNSGGTIISNTGIVIGGDGNARTNAFTNRFGGVVETISGNISIAAVTFGNLRDAPELAEGVSTDGDQGNADCQRDTCYDEIRETDQIIYDHDPSRIISAGHITITADDATNAFSSISAFGNITITADTLINVGQNYYRNEGGVATFIGADFGVIEAGGNLNLTNITGYIQNGAQTALTNDRTGSSDTDLTTISIDSIGNPDLLVTNRDPDAEFLVETREEFVDLDQFVSSDYFLQAIAYDPELRRFGDAYAEALFIRKQLQELLGQLILTTGIDERAQIEAMYNNAIDALENLDLTPGVALTPDQIGALTSDIIWMEETVIDGERVLAPKVYLANPEIRFAGLSGAMITGRNVDVRTRNFDNSGNIRATDSLSIAVSETFRSTGGTVSAENIAVIGNNIEIVTGAQTLMTERGQQVRLPALRTSGWTDSEDVALPAATFAAGSTIVLTARDAITTAGAQIAAGDNITLLAGGDITIGALRLASATGNRSGSNRNFVERVDHLTTSLTAGGDILLLSSGNVAGQNNIMLEGARLTAGGNVGMIAQDGDLLLAAVQDFYFRDYRRKKSGAFGFNTKIREQMTTRITNQVVQIAGASITGVADTNIYVEGSRFTIPGMANSDLAPGQLAMVSVNGSSVFDAPFDLFAETSYRNNSTLWGLVSNSTTSNSAHSIARSVFAETAGDIALNSGGDLTLTAVDFNAGGQFVTQVSGTTYLLAAINQNYSFTQTHRDNGIIMTDTTVEDINESVTFNRIAAAGGVNLDPTSQIVLAGVRDPLFDSTHPAAWASMADNGRSNLANAWLGTGAEASADDSDSADNSHWREGGEWSEKGTLLVRQVALPTGVDGAEYAYLDGVLARDSTINDPIELVNYHFYDRQQALNPAFKALLTIAVTQGMGGLEFLQLGTNLGLSGSMATAVNAATSSFAATLTVETTAGLVSGNLDMGQIVGTASFSALSAGLTSGINLDTFGASFEGVDWANTSAFRAAGLGFGKNLTVAKLVDAGINATLTAGLSSAVYDTDFLDSFAASMRSGAINLAMADLQSGIGDGVKARRYAEGDLSHAALHGLVGCAAGEALGGNCASGFAAGVAQSIYAGTLDGTGPDKSDIQAYNAWRAQVANQAELIGAGVGYLTSGGLAANVSNGGSIAQSGAVNNYLSHTQFAQMIDAFAACDGDTTCLRETLGEYREISLRQEHEMALCGTDLTCLSKHIPHLLDTADSELINGFLTQLGPQDLQDPVVRQLMDQIVALQRTAQTTYGVTPSRMTNGFSYTYSRYPEWSANHCAGLDGSACMARFQTDEVHGRWGITHLYQSWRSGVQMYTLAAGGAAIAATPAAIAAMGRCMQSAVCLSELTVAVGEISGATAGQITFTAVVGGKMVMQHGDEIVGVLDDALDIVLRPAGATFEGRMLLDIPSGGVGYYNDAGQLVRGQIDDAGRFVAPNTGFRSSDEAFDAIGDFRSRTNITDAQGGTGTVAVTDVNGQRYFGVNSTNLTDADKNLARGWRDRLGLSRGQDQVVFHAEAHSLMRAYDRTNGNLPSNMNLYVDRNSCGTCQTYLPRMAEEMGISNLNLSFTSGRTAVIRNGTFEWVD